MLARPDQELNNITVVLLVRQRSHAKLPVLGRSNHRRRAFKRHKDPTCQSCARHMTGAIYVLDMTRSTVLWNLGSYQLNPGIQCRKSLGPELLVMTH